MAPIYVPADDVEGFMWVTYFSTVTGALFGGGPGGAFWAAVFGLLPIGL